MGLPAGGASANPQPIPLPSARGDSWAAGLPEPGLAKVPRRQPRGQDASGGVGAAAGPARPRLPPPKQTTAAPAAVATAPRPPPWRRGPAPPARLTRAPAGGGGRGRR